MSLGASKNAPATGAAPGHGVHGRGPEEGEDRNPQLGAIRLRWHPVALLVRAPFQPGGSILWMDEEIRSTHGKPLFVGIFKRIILLGTLRCCEMDFVHPHQEPPPSAPPFPRGVSKILHILRRARKGAYRALAMIIEGPVLEDPLIPLLELQQQLQTFAFKPCGATKFAEITSLNCPLLVEGKPISLLGIFLKGGDASKWMAWSTATTWG